MAKYENEFSNFPQEKITLHKFQNVDNSVADLISQINTLRSNGMYSRAQAIIAENPELNKYIADANTINTLIEEIYNSQTYAQSISVMQQTVRFDNTEPDQCDVADVWISPFI